MYAPLCTCNVIKTLVYLRDFGSLFTYVVIKFQNLLDTKSI